MHQNLNNAYVTPAVKLGLIIKFNESIGIIENQIDDIKLRLKKMH